MQLNKEHTPLKIIFAGTPEFAVPCLQALLDSQHQVVCVYTQPDRPAGRGRNLTAPPVKKLANQYEISVKQPLSLSSREEQQAMSALQPDLVVVVAYGLILPPAILNLPRYGCINVHASLLPRWRGAAPIQRAIASGDKVTGITIMQMNKGLDTGDILYQLPCAIAAENTAVDLHHQLAQLGAVAITQALELLLRGELIPKPQDSAQATYAAKLDKNDSPIDWTKSATEIANQIRALQPWPMATMQFNQQMIKIWQAMPINQENQELSPGALIRAHKHEFDIACGQGVLRLLSLQCPNRARVTATDFINAEKNRLIPKKTLFG